MASPKPIGLALQGGGSHAAFTWGALDRLLDAVEDDKLHIQAISGASGGALNGAVCVYGLIKGPREAKQLLKRLWDSVASESMWPVDPYRMLLPKESPLRYNVDWDPIAIGLGMAEQIVSPYWSPWSTNIIGSLVRTLIDFEELKNNASHLPPLFVCATNVNKTAVRIFTLEEISAEALMASACYPTLFRAVEIEKEFYWDGGYLANPALNPLVDSADDLLTILIDPLDVVRGPPTTARQIVNRINEVSFNASWVLEVRQVELINQLLEKGKLKDTKYRKKRLHLIRNDRFMEEIGAASKQSPTRDLIYELRDLGREAADRWLSDHYGDLGARSSLDVKAEVALRLKGLKYN